MEGGDWRSQLQPESRKNVINKIMETLKGHIPFSGQEGMEELKQIAIRFEEKIFSASTTQSEYLRKISLKMLTMESKSQGKLTNPMPPNFAGRNPQDPVSSQNMQSLAHGQNQSVPPQMVPNQSQARQQFLAQNIQNNIASRGLQTTTSLSNTIPTNGLAQNPMPNNAQGVNSNMQNVSGISQNSMGNTLNQGIASGVFSDAQKQLLGRPQQTQNSQQFMYESMKHQNTQQNMHTSFGMQMQPSVVSGMQHNQQSSTQHPTQQSVIRKQQQPVLSPQPNVGNMQRSQLDYVSDLQQKRMLGQQNSIQNLAAQQSINHQSTHHNLIGQQINLQNLHQKQLGQQSHVEAQQLIGINKQQSVHMVPQTKVAVKQESQNVLPGCAGPHQQQSQSNALQQNMQGIQNMTPLILQQKLIDQQKLFPSQSATEAPSTSLDATAEKGCMNVHDWQEEVYQKIQYMKGLYYADLNDTYRKISIKLQEHDSLPHQPNTDQIEKLRVVKLMLEKLMQFFLITKNNILPSHKVKLPSLEKQISHLLHLNKPRKPVPPIQHPRFQIPQAQSYGGRLNPQLQPTNIQSSVTSLHGFTSSQPNIPSMSQPGSNLHSGLTNIRSCQPQSGVNLLQPNVSNNSPSMLQNQHVKQQQEQQTKESVGNMFSLHSSPKQKMHENMRHLGSSAIPQHLSSSQCFENQQSNALSAQINQHSSKKDQQNIPPSVVSKGETPLHSEISPFAVPSPLMSFVPSPMPGDNEIPVVSSLTNAANGGHQQTSGAPQSLSISTPAISPSPLLKWGEGDCTFGNTSNTVSGKSNITEQPIQRLLRAVKSMSPKALTGAISDISSVVSEVDCVAGSAPGNGSRAMVGEDLVAMTKWRFQARNFPTQDGSSGTKRMRQYTTAMPLNVGAFDGGINDSLKQLNEPYTPELQSTATSGVKKARVEVYHALLDEIREINQRLIDTIVTICDEEGTEGTVVKCSYDAVTLGPSLKAQFTSALMSPIQPLRLLVPANYPNCSPVLLDKLPVGVSNEYEDLSIKAKSRFSTLLRSLPPLMSLWDMAWAWDECARTVIIEFAQRYGGGTFSSNYGNWDNCSSARAVILA